MKMTTEEAFVKVLQMHGIEHAFGIIGSAMMPISDIFGEACWHHLLGLRPRRVRRLYGRRLHPRHRQDVDDDRAKRPRHHQLRDRRKNRLLEPHPALAGDPTGRQQDYGSGRLPGNGTNAHVRGLRLLSGRGPRSLAHGRSPEPRDHAGQTQLGPRTDQRAA